MVRAISNKFKHSSIVGLRNILYDIAGNVFVFFLCHVIFEVILQRDNISLLNTFLSCILYLFILLLMSFSYGRYDISQVSRQRQKLGKAFMCCIVATTVTTCIFYFTSRASTNRGFYALYFVLCIAVHLAAAFISYRQNRMQNLTTKTIFVGSRRNYKQVLDYISYTNISFDLIGYLSLNDDGSDSDGEYLGFVNDGDLERILRGTVVDQVWILNEERHHKDVLKCLELCVNFGVNTKLIFIDEYSNKCSFYLSRLGSYPVISYHLNSLDPITGLIKRIMDIGGSLAGILLSAPILLLSAIAIKLDSKGPVFFTQTRVGKNGRRFKITKLRTMEVDAEAQKHELMGVNEMSSNLMFKVKADPRITRVGAFLRKTSIDEIPQFFNVLQGSMSLVGTRPPTLDEVGSYEPRHWRRLRIKPGITGLWQVSGRNSISDFDEIVALDTAYIESWSILTDIKIILKTFVVVFKRKGAY